jgi:hypothetical protein
MLTHRYFNHPTVIPTLTSPCLHQFLHVFSNPHRFSCIARPLFTACLPQLMLHTTTPPTCTYDPRSFVKSATPSFPPARSRQARPRQCLQAHVRLPGPSMVLCLFSVSWLPFGSGGHFCRPCVSSAGPRAYRAGCFLPTWTLFGSLQCLASRPLDVDHLRDRKSAL